MTKGRADPLCFFKGGNGHLAGHSGKIAEEFVELLSTFQVVQQGLKGHARVPKNGCSAQNVRILRDGVASHLRLAERLAQLEGRRGTENVPSVPKCPRISPNNLEQELQAQLEATGVSAADD